MTDNNSDLENRSKKIWYFILVLVYSVAYFFYAIFAGIYGWIKEKFLK